MPYLYFIPSVQGARSLDMWVEYSKPSGSLVGFAFEIEIALQNP